MECSVIYCFTQQTLKFLQHINWCKKKEKLSSLINDDELKACLIGPVLQATPAIVPAAAAYEGN